MHWGGFETVLAIAQCGSLSGAARLLAVSHATVFRRLNAIEGKLGVALFHRSRTGYTPTLAGEELATTALRIESEVLAAERKVADRDLQPMGEVAVATTDALLVGLLSVRFARFRHEFPGISLDVAVTGALSPLTRREADIAIRSTNAPPDTLIGHRLAVLGQAVYGRRTSAPQQDQGGPDIYSRPWIGPGPRHEDQALVKWMTAQQLDAQCHYRVDTVLGMFAAVRGGLGLAILPSYLGDSDPDLVALSAPIPELETGLWFLLHPDLRGITRIQSLLTFVSESLGRQNPSPGRFTSH